MCDNGRHQEVENAIGAFAEVVLGVVLGVLVLAGVMHCAAVLAR